jgi:putative Holliday junction resolvase
MDSAPRRASALNPATNSQPGRILAMDYGRRRIGLAISDELELTAQPLETLARTNRARDLRRLREIVRKHAVRRILVGLPLHLDGTAGEMADEAARFAARMGKQLGLPVELVDERLSSWEAEQALAQGQRFGVRRRRARSGREAARRHGAEKQRGEVDQVAAAILLRDYLERLARQRQQKG